MSLRIPNLFHLLLLLALTFFALLFSEALFAVVHAHHIAAMLQNQRLQLFANSLTYFFALGAAALLFPFLWKMQFRAGLHWNAAAARWFMIPAGILLGFASQAASTLLPIPKNLPIQKEFAIPGIIWFLAVFGTLVAPLFEEIVFRGFLLPALAIAVDYLRLPKSLEALETWRSSQNFSVLALVTSSLLTSLLFAGMHAPQLGFSVPAVALLAVISLVLCAVRLGTDSVAASTLVHASYNFSVFLTLFLATHGFTQMDRL